MRILVADSNEDFRTILTEIISDEEDLTGGSFRRRRKGGTCTDS